MLAGAALYAVPPVQAWPSPVPGAPVLSRFSQAHILRWGADYIHIDYYVDADAFARSVKEDPLERMLAGKVWCGTRLVFQRGISAKRRRETFEDQFRRHWPGGGYDRENPVVKAFFAFVARPLERGDHLDYLVDPKGVLRLRHGQEAWGVFKERGLALAFLSLMYRGEPHDPETAAKVTSDLKAFLEGSGEPR